MLSLPEVLLTDYLPVMGPAKKKRPGQHIRTYTYIHFFHLSNLIYGLLITLCSPLTYMALYCVFEQIVLRLAVLDNLFHHLLQNQIIIQEQ